MARGDRALERVAGLQHGPVRLRREPGRAVDRYVSDWGKQGIGVFLDDIAVSTEGTTESFEDGFGAWTVAGPPPGSAVNGNDWTRTADVGFEEGAVVTMTPADAAFRSVYFGSAVEGVTTATSTALMARASTS